MKALTKAERESVRAMFDGRCAYCGVDLPQRWHVDHVEAVFRDWYGKTGKAFREDNHRLDNMMPSCPPCNINKGPLSLESWRKEISHHLQTLNNNRSTYRIVKSFGLLIETGAPVRFHFETVTEKP